MIGIIFCYLVSYHQFVDDEVPCFGLYEDCGVETPDSTPEILLEPEIRIDDTEAPIPPYDPDYEEAAVA